MISSKRDSCSQLVAGNYDVIVDDLDSDLSTTTASNSTTNRDENNLKQQSNPFNINNNNVNTSDNNNLVKTILTDFLEHYDQHESDLVNNPQQCSYANEFKLLKEFSKSLKENKANLQDGELECNYTKNRYRDILPFNHTRVILKSDPSIPGSEYINANYIKGPSGNQNAYIACQGPLACTLADFWQMIWECNVSIIVMACNENESGKPKCELYWPEEVGSSEFYGNIQCNLLRVRQICTDFLIRKFSIKLLEPLHSNNNSNNNCLKEENHLQNQQVSSTTNINNDNYKSHDTKNADYNNMDTNNHNNKGQTVTRKVLSERTICQFHYTTWPDHGAPDSIQPILEMVRLIRDVQPEEDKPILVHCSAGCGRTGTICCIDYVGGLLRLNKLDSNFNLFNIISEMRQQRMAMVQTLEQYILCHRAVAALFMSHLRNYIEPTEDLFNLTNCINDLSNEDDDCFRNKISDNDMALTSALNTTTTGNCSEQDEQEFVGPVFI